MHAKGHTDPCCLRECHPDAEHNKPVVENVNTYVKVYIDVDTFSSLRLTDVRVSGLIGVTALVH